jgi:4-hydroxy-tetrahydrodipicolinate synthase
MIEGIISTPMTPFDKNGNLDLKLIKPYCEWQKKAGVSGFYILGTWGGYSLMSVNERKLVIKEFCQVCEELGLQCIVHVGSNTYEEIFELIKCAEYNKATAISSLLPNYYSTAGYLELKDYKRYFSKIIENTKLPVYLYNNERSTNVLISPEEFLELVKIGLSGVKDGSKSVSWLIKTQYLLKQNSLKANIIPGNTVGILYGLIYGCKAFTSGASVVFPKEVVKIKKLFYENKIIEATNQHIKVLKLRESMSICSSAPSTAHFLLREMDKSLGYNRKIWPDFETDDYKILLEKINNIKSIDIFL